MTNENNKGEQQRLVITRKPIDTDVDDKKFYLYL